MKGSCRVIFAEMNMLEEKMHSLSPPLYSMSLRDEKEMEENEYIDVDNSSDTTGYMNGHSSDEGGPESSGCKSPDSDGDMLSLCDKKDIDGMRNRSMADKKLYRCTHCKYVTDRKNNLKRHVVTMHETCTKVLECCDVIFQNKASLRDHVLSCHKNGYDCRICGRNFCRKALLKRHITVHSGQKDYICNVCGYATSHKSNLDRHKRRHGPKFPSDDMDLHRPDSLSPPPLDMRKFIPTDFSCSPIPDTMGLPYQRELTHIRPYYSSKHKFRNGKYIFTKRLLCTYDKSYTNKEKELQESEHNDVNKNTIHTNQGFENSQNETCHVLKRNNNHNNFLHPKNARVHSTRRLFPTLYKCKECGLVLDTQLQLTSHLEEGHKEEQTQQMPPQRPLTLQAKPRGWLY